MEFKAGTHQINITPPLGTLINGDFVSHYAREIHDDLFAKALVLKNQSETIVFLVVDICLMDKPFTDDVKTAVYEKHNIPAQNILISGTHTHAAGSVMNVLLGAADLPYRMSLKNLLFDAVDKALGELQPAKVAFGSVNAPEFVRCRRYYMKEGFNKPNIITGLQDTVKTNPFGGGNFIDKPSGPTDPELSYMAIKSVAGEWISILANYSLHYVGDWDNGTISADYFGFFANRLIKNLKVGNNFVGIMSNGTSGDINIWDFENPESFPKENFKKSELIGNSLADKLTNSLEELSWDSNPHLQVKYTEKQLQVRKPSMEELQAAEALVKQTDFSKFSITDKDALKKLYAREQILLHHFPDTVEMPLQLFKIGKGKIGGMAGEFFAETGLKLKSINSFEKYFTITMANGIFGYVPPSKEMGKGGYESWRSRNSYLETSAEEIILATMAEYINS